MAGGGDPDGSIFAFCACGDGVEDLELDDFSDKEFAEEFTGVEGEWLRKLLAIVELFTCSPYVRSPRGEGRGG